MNIIALSLGLVPVPPLPPEVIKRQRATALARENNVPRRYEHRSSVEYRVQILDMLRDTGPANTLEVAVYLNCDPTTARGHLATLVKSGQIRRETLCIKGRAAYLWSIAEQGQDDA